MDLWPSAVQVTTGVATGILIKLPPQTTVAKATPEIPVLAKKNSARECLGPPPRPLLFVHCYFGPGLRH